MLNGMAVRKRRTAWDILTKMAALTVRTRFEPVRTGSKQKQNERFAWDFLQNTGSNSVRNQRMAVRKRQTAWDILTKTAVFTVRTRFETKGWRFENGKPRETSSQKPLSSRFERSSIRPPASKRYGTFFFVWLLAFDGKAQSMRSATAVMATGVA